MSMRKILSFLLALVICVSPLSIVAYAAEVTADAPTGEFTFVDSVADLTASDTARTFYFTFDFAETLTNWMTFNLKVTGGTGNATISANQSVTGGTVSLYAADGGRSPYKDVTWSATENQGAYSNDPSKTFKMNQIDGFDLNIPANAYGNFTITLEVTEWGYYTNYSTDIADTENTTNYVLKGGATKTYTTTVSVAAPPQEVAAYDIYYKLTNTDDDIEETPDGYKEYAANDTVVAEVYLVSNEADVTLQAYDIYLDYSDKLLYQTQNLIGATAYQAGVNEDGTNKVANAEDKVLHIQAVGDDNKAVVQNLAKGEHVKLGQIEFKFAENAQYDEELPITLTEGEKVENETGEINVTHISIANGVDTSVKGNVNAYYPAVTQIVTVDGEEMTFSGAEIDATYKVTFETNDGSAVPEQEVGHNLTATKPADPTKANHKFDGWYADKDLTTTYTFNEKVTADATIYAKWEATTYKVTWYGADSKELYNETVNAGNTTSFDENKGTKPQDYADEQYNYTFVGWNTAPGMEAGLDLTTYKIEKETNFYPAFSKTPVEYTVTWKSWDGNDTLHTEDFVYGATPVYNGTIEPSRAPDQQYTYVFAGWATGADKTEGETLPVVTGPATYYAAFSRTLNKYDVAYSDENTDGIFEDQEWGTEIKLPDAKGKDGHHFVGWFDGDTNVGGAGDKYTVEKDVDLVAKYAANTYYVQFNANAPEGETAEGVMENQDFVYGVDENLTTNAFEITGYAFQEWNTEPDGTGDAYQNNALGSNMVTENGETVQLYAIWSESDWTITATGVNNGTVTVNPSTANYEDPINVIVDPADGYEFGEDDKVTITYTDATGEHEVEVPVTDENGDGIYEGTFDMPNANVEITATFSAIAYEYTTSYDAEKGTLQINGTASGTATVGTVMPVMVTPKAGYKIGEVTYTYKNAQNEEVTNSIPVTKSTGNDYTGSFDMPASDVTVTAIFAPITYTIRFNKNTDDEVVGVLNDITANYDQAILVEELITRTNYKVADWNMSADGTGSNHFIGSNFLNLSSIDGDIVDVFAIWEAKTFEIELVTNGGTINSGAVDKYTYGVGATLPTDVTMNNYNFAGWYSNEELTAGPVNSVSADASGNQKFWAKWTPMEYTINYLDKDGSTLKTGTYTYGETPALDTTVTKNGYTFVAWYTNTDYTGDPVANVPAGASGTLNYYAKWQRNDYTITFITNGDPIAPMTYTIESTEKLPEATRTNYNFDKWQVTAIDETKPHNWELNSTHNANDNSLTGYYGDVTLTALWKEARTLVVEEYKYSLGTGYVLLRVADDIKTEGNIYTFAGAPMYYTTDTNYLVAGSTATGVYYQLIEEKYMDGAKLNADGLAQLKSERGERLTLTYDGKINNDQVVNIADANVVYQMVQNGGSYYSMDQLNTVKRLAADMAKATNDTGNEKRASIKDVHAIVTIINQNAN